MKAVFALIAFTLMAACALAGAAGMHVPAVAVNGGGEMVWLSVEVRNGTGLVYSTTSPLIGTDTQVSERTAVAVGLGTVGMYATGYDAFVTMDAGDTSEVDGPSAGAAMTLLTIAALNGSRVRGDLTITGTIESDGSIGPVGGIVKKVEAASEIGLKYVLIPRETEISDKIIIAGLEQKLNVSIIEVSDIGGAAAIAFSPEGSVAPEPMERVPLPISNLSAYTYGCPGCGVEKFAAIARSVVAADSANVRSLKNENLGAYSAVLPYLEKSAADARAAAAGNYYYTAANTAFLNQANAAMLRNTNLTRDGLLSALADAGDCIAELDRPVLTRENLQFVAGGDLRVEWAKSKLSDTENLTSLMSDGDYEGILGAYHEALYAKGWCDVASELYSAGRKIGGAPANEGALEAYAQHRVAEAAAGYARTDGSDTDTGWHLRIAQKSLDGSRFGAAIFDADYVLGALRTGNESLETMNESRDLILARKGKALWSALFLAHASYYGKADPSSVGTVLRLGYIADGLESDSLQMDAILEHPESAPAFGHTPTPVTQTDIESFNSSLIILVVLLCGLLAASAVLNIILMTLMKSKKRAEIDALVKGDKRLKRK